MKYLKPYKWQAISGFIFKLIEAFLELCIPMAVALIIDNGVAVHNTNYITKMAFVIFGLSTVGYASSLVCQYFASLTSQGVGTLMRKDMYRAINRYDYQDLDIIGTPSLITRITNDINQIQLAVAMVIRLCSRSPFLIVLLVIVAPSPGVDPPTLTNILALPPPQPVKSAATARIMRLPRRERMSLVIRILSLGVRVC